MIKQRLRCILPVLAVLLSFSLAISVFAAFLSAGHRKGVAVASSYYFTSNVLTAMGDEPQSYACIDNGTTTSLAVQVRNHDSQLIPNPFEVTYQLSYQLVGDAGSLYSYYIGEQQITSAQPVVMAGMTLTGSQLSSHTYNISFVRAEGTLSDPSQAATIRLIATPTSPIIMTSYVIGADISLSENSTAFSATGEFDYIANNEALTNLAGFMYHVITTGTVPPGEQEYILLKWNADMLELDEQNEYISTDNVTDSVEGEGEDAVHYKTLRLQVESGEYLSFSFYRADGWVDGTTDISGEVELRLSSEKTA